MNVSAPSTKAARRADVSSAPVCRPAMMASMRRLRSPPRTPQRQKGSLAISVLSWLGDRVDDEILERSLALFEHQSELLAQNRGCGRVGGGRVDTNQRLKSR